MCMAALFPSPWPGGALYTMGGVVRDVQNPMATTAPDGAPMLLAAYAVTAAGGGGISVQYDTARVAAAEQQWGAVRPGSLSGCGSWVDTSSSQVRCHERPSLKRAPAEWVGSSPQLHALCLHASH